MIQIRPSHERGHTRNSWLDSRHTFSFEDYYNPRQIGYRAIRVINEDKVEPGGTFPFHPHRDMEIFTYVLSGALSHQDTLGTGSMITAGQFQLMSAGSGIRHSEYNPSKDEPAHFLQVWIKPHTASLPPRYTEWHPAPEHKNAPFVLLMSSDGRENSAQIEADVLIWRVQIKPGQQLLYPLRKERGLWLQVVKGTLTYDGTAMEAGDGGFVEGEGDHSIEGTSDCEALLFDLA